MKRYLLFTWYAYEQGGGWLDYRGSYHSADEALESEHVRGNRRLKRPDRFHIVDTFFEKITASDGSGYEETLTRPQSSAALAKQP